MRSGGERPQTGGFAGVLASFVVIPGCVLARTFHTQAQVGIPRCGVPARVQRAERDLLSMGRSCGLAYTLFRARWARGRRSAPSPPPQAILASLCVKYPG